MVISKMSLKMLLISLIGLLAISCANTVEQKEVLSKKNIEIEDGVSENEFVADGFDLISYFELENAEKGNPQISLLIKGAKLFFSNEENKKKFIANAEKYLPKYEEFCPVSLSNDKLIKGKPKHYVVYKDKLYFFFNKQYADEFEKDPETYLKKASEKWKDVKK